MKELRSDTRLLVPLLPLIGAFVACVDDRQSSTAIVRDSAGVRIVENTTGHWESKDQWYLGSTPALDIGGGETDANYQLFRVRGVMRLSDGTVVVANDGSHELRFYDADGNHVRTVGGQGRGPGEFTEIFHAVPCGTNSIVTFDRQSRRVSVFDAVGQFLHSFSPASLIEGGWPPLSISCQPGGRMAVVGRGGSPGPSLAEPGPSRRSVPIFIGQTDGDSFKRFGVVDGSESYLWRSERAGYLSPRPFGTVTSVAIANDRLYVATGDRYEIEVYTLEGDLTELIRKRYTPPRVTAGDIQRFKEVMLDTLSFPRRRQLVEPLFDQVQHRETMAAYGRMLVDGTGHLWVEEYLRPGDEQPLWTVFTPEGKMLGDVETPPDLQLVQVGRDFVLGVRKDQLGVEHVQRAA